MGTGDARDGTATTIIVFAECRFNFGDESCEAPMMSLDDVCRLYTLDARVMPSSCKFRFGDRVRKISGSSWQGRVVGFYSTRQTPVGYAVESEREPGAVQVYAEGALELISLTGSSELDVT